ncbi:MAG: hypothetical protein ACOCZ8_00755 [Bacteroidota bacterium]
MYYRILHLMLALVLAAGLQPALAKYDVNKPEPGTDKKGTGKAPRTAEACLPATSTAELNINNTRALLHNGGDMWWDLLSNPRYEIPKVDNPADAKHSMFASSLWIGGFDGSGQLRIAAQTYRQSGNDFFPGPVRIDGTASVERDICQEWDKHFNITRSEIDAFIAAYEADPANVDLAQFPNVRDWPGTYDNPEFAKNLAPYVDVDNNGEYNPSGGDYPDIVGDQAIWWVINDKGDIHTETNGEQIGVEIQMLAFAFATSDAVNNMTFYKELVINRSTNVLNDCYIGQWVDADLGFFADDYVGCDTVRGLGFCYNGDNYDDEPTGYGSNPPAIGVDFFQGPFADANDGIDNDKDGEIDEVDSLGNPERISMAKFIYYNNDFSVRGNPATAQHFYGYLSGFWRNGAAIVDDRTGNGNGFPDPGESAEPTDYMFPDFPGAGCGTSSCNAASYQPDEEPWDEKCLGTQPFDRRFVQSAGPFTLQPGAQNEIVVGVVWARDLNAGDEIGSLCQLLQADDIAQSLFDNNFQILTGPDAPDVTAHEYDREIVLTWDNASGNNELENYAQPDPILAAVDTIDPFYRFEGYIVYQLRDGSVSSAELDNTRLSRPIATYDIDNGVTTIINRETQRLPGIEDEVITDVVKVEGNDQGLRHSIRIREDAFDDGSDSRLVNYRDYYFAVVAYAHNGSPGVDRRFIRGNGNFQRVAATPHKNQFENLGLQLNSEYGDGPIVTKLTGLGNGGEFVGLRDGLEDEILQNGQQQIEYAPGESPINLRVVNPKEVQNMQYRVDITRDKEVETRVINNEDGTIDTIEIYTDWELWQADPSNPQANVGDEPIFQSRWTILKKYFPSTDTLTIDTLPKPLEDTERYIDGHGFVVSIADVPEPGTQAVLNTDNGVIGAEIEYEDPSKPWLSALPDIDGFDLYNWIRSGPAATTCAGGGSLVDGECIGGTDAPDSDYRIWVNEETYQAFNAYDPGQNFETLLNGAWAPYILTAHFHTIKDIIGPRMKITREDLSSPNASASIENFLPLPDLPNVNIVITSDPSKWSRCLVVETSPSKTLSTGAFPMAPRWTLNKERNGDNCELSEVGGTLDPDGPRLDQPYGFSYFPGYAVDVDRGVRLNLFFGESS